MSKGIPAPDIQKYIPHRPPMVWIDYVTAYGATEGAATIEIKGDALYMSPEGLRPSSLIEMIAQTYGFVWICHVTRNLDPTSKGMSVAMLAAFKDVKFAPPSALAKIKHGDVLNCKVSNLKRKGPVTMFQGHIWHGDVLLAEADMRTYSQ